MGNIIVTPSAATTNSEDSIVLCTVMVWTSSMFTLEVFVSGVVSSIWKDTLRIPPR